MPLNNNLVGRDVGMHTTTPTSVYKLQQGDDLQEGSTLLALGVRRTLSPLSISRSPSASRAHQAARSPPDRSRLPTPVLSNTAAAKLRGRNRCPRRALWIARDGFSHGRRKAGASRAKRGETYGSMNARGRYFRRRVHIAGHLLLYSILHVAL